MTVGPYGVDRLDLIVGPLCGECSRQRLALNGRPLQVGEACECGALAIRVPRKPGQIVGDLIEVQHHPNGGTE